MNLSELLESAALWLGKNALLTALPAVLIGWVCWQRWGSARARFVLAGLVLVKLVTPDLPGWNWEAPWTDFWLAEREMEAKTETAAWFGSGNFGSGSLEANAGMVEGNVMVETAQGPAWWAVVWLLGVMTAGGWWMAGVWRVNRWARRQRVAAPARVVRLLAEESRSMGLPASPELCVLRDWGQAAVHGWWRVRVLLPAAWVERLGEEELRVVLRHELAHVRRRDVLWSTLGFAVAALHWFHPLGWLALRRLRAEAELLCDEAALAGSGDAGRKHYGRVLVRMIEPFSPAPPQAVAAFARHRTDIQHRIHMIAQPNLTQRWSRVMAWLILPVLSLALITAGEVENPKSEARSLERKGEKRDEGSSREGGREGDKRREGLRDGDRSKEGPRDGERPREGARDGDRPKEGLRDGERPREGARDGDRPKEGPRDGERPREGARDGERGRDGMRETEGAKRGVEGAERGGVNPAAKAPAMVIQLNAAGQVVNGEGRVIPDAEVKQRIEQIVRANPGQEIVLRGEMDTHDDSLARVLSLLKDIDVKPIFTILSESFTVTQ